MSPGNPSYEGAQQNDTPLPTVAARAAWRALEAAPGTLTISQALARLALTGTIMAALIAVFMAFVGPALH